MMDMAYAQPLIANGRLIQLAPTITLEEGYFLVHQAKRRSVRWITSFRDWLISAAK